MTDPLVYAHLGDLHLTTETEENYRDLLAIVDVIARDFAGSLDFVYLPGDNADNGTRAQYALVRRAIERLPLPVHVITGDHDMEQGSLEAFYGELGAPQLPKAVDVKGVRCLFLDISGPGTGGPDFRLGAEQTAWLEAELATAAAQGTRCAIFMHTYPADLRGDGETAAINAALAAREVLLVDMGHTHYNELANDGRTIFSATRSTGQIEEGPVGFSIVSIDRRAVSWRFRTLTDERPLVVITAPVDRRLAFDPDDPDHLPGPRCELRVSVLWPRPIASCTCVVDDGAPQPLREISPGRWTATLDLDGAATIIVEATDDRGATGRETIELASAADLAVERRADGSDADAVAAWEARHVLGTQLGPNRNGRKW
jgi:hypothetical protein